MDSHGQSRTKMAQVPTQSGPCGLASETLQRSSSNSTGAEGVYEWNEKGLT